MANDGMLVNNNSASSIGLLDRNNSKPEFELMDSDFVPSHNEIVNKSTSKVSVGEPAEEMHFTHEADEEENGEI